MSRAINFLQELDDYELAFFAKFKSQTYMRETRQIISEYLVERHLNQKRIDQLIAENPKSKLEDERERCPRCYSDKIRKDQVEWTNTSGGVGIEDEVATWDGAAGRATYKNQVICNVCGFWLEDPNQERPLPTSKKVLYHLWDIVLGVLRNN